MQIRGKEYMEVKDRVMVFRKNNPSWSIITKIIENNEETGSVIFKATIEDADGRIRGTGHAHEFKEDKSSMVNKTSHLENCETSAIGRALGSLGIGIESSYASYDEVVIAKDKEAREKSREQFDDRMVELDEAQSKLNAMKEEMADIKEGKIRQSAKKPRKKSSVKVIKDEPKEPKDEPSWRDHMLHKGKFEGMTLGQITEIPADKSKKESGGISYLRWMSTLEIQSDSLRHAIDACMKELDQDGRQGFEQVG